MVAETEKGESVNCAFAFCVLGCRWSSRRQSTSSHFQKRRTKSGKISATFCEQFVVGELVCEAYHEIYPWRRFDGLAVTEETCKRSKLDQLILPVYSFKIAYLGLGFWGLSLTFLTGVLGRRPTGDLGLSMGDLLRELRLLELELFERLVFRSSSLYISPKPL